MASPALVRDLSRLLGPAAVSDSAGDRAAHGRDMWARVLMETARGAPASWPPDVVARPATDREVAAVVRYAARRRIPLVPFGAGSGVCGAALALRGGIALDMRRMARVVDVSHGDHAATFEAGIFGDVVEDVLSRAHLTLGHFPSSIFCSTLGGWIAARSAGQCSSRHGKIEDFALGLDAITGTGERIATDRESPGDLGPLLIGSEGTLAVVTRARVRVAPAPEARAARGLRFADVASGMDGMRRLMQAGLRPAVVRLYDEADTLLAGGTARGGSRRTATRSRLPTSLRARMPSLRARLVRAALGHTGLLNLAVGELARRVRRDGCLLVVLFEGPAARVAVESAAGLALLRDAGGDDLGEAPGERWLMRRYAVSHRYTPMFAAGAFVDTMEVATTWGRLPALYASVRAALVRHAFVMAHLSHAYPEGCSIYFTFAGANDAGALGRYDACWRDGMAAALAAGSTISHHHGVGLLKTPYMKAEHGAAMALLARVKAALDPAGILNPGKLGLA